MKADAKTEADVTDTLNKFANAYGQRNMDSILALLSPDPDVVVTGTGVDEKRTGFSEIKLQIERDWSQSEAISMKIVPRIVSMAGKVAWVTADLAFHVKASGQETSIQARLTTVLEQRGKNWLIAQYHSSLPAAGQKEGSSFPEQ